MASYKVEIKNSAKKEIRQLPSKELRAKIVDTINRLCNNSLPYAVNVV